MLSCYIIFTMTFLPRATFDIYVTPCQEVYKEIITCFSPSVIHPQSSCTGVLRLDFREVNPAWCKFKKACVSEQSRSLSKHLSLYPRFDVRDDVCNPFRTSSGLHLELDPFPCWPKRDLQRSSLTRLVQVPMLRTWIGTQSASDAYL